MLLVYNTNGSIKYKFFDDYIMQGSNRVNKIFVAIVGYDHSNYSCSAFFNLPNGETTNELGVYDQNGTTISGETYYGYIINLTVAETFYPGTVKCSIRLTNTSNQILYTYAIDLVVNPSVIDPDTPISAAEYNSYLAQLGMYQIAFNESNVRSYPSLSYLETLDTTLGTYPKNLLALNQVFFVYDSATQSTQLYKCTTAAIKDINTGLYTSDAVIGPHHLSVYHSVNADLSARATADGAGENIVATYLRKDARQDQTLPKVANVDSNGTVPLTQIPDVIKKAIFLGGTISTIVGGSAIVTVTQAFKDKFGYVGNTLTITQLETANDYEGSYFLVATSGEISIDGVNYQAVNDGDWVISIGTKYIVVDQGVVRTYFTYDSGTQIATFQTKADLSGSAIVGFTNDTTKLYGINANGANVQIPNAATNKTGAMSSTDKTKLDLYPQYANLPSGLGLVVSSSALVVGTPPANWTIGTPTVNKIRKYGKIVAIELYVSITKTDAGATYLGSSLFTIPLGYRPIEMVVYGGMLALGIPYANRINTDGTIVLPVAADFALNDATPFAFTITYIID